MAKANTDEELLRRPLYVYDIPGQVLETLALKENVDGDETESPPATQSNQEQGAVPETSLTGAQSCSMCSMAFTEALDQRSHLRSDLHHYNLKQKMRGQQPVSETEFERLMENLDESLSGSDSDDSEDELGDGRQEPTALATLLKKQARLADRANDAHDGDDGAQATDNSGRAKPPLIWFSSRLLPDNTYFGLYRTILTGDELRNTDLVQVLREKQIAPLAMPARAKDAPLPTAANTGPHIFLCMIGGGHFAAMIVSLAPRAAAKGAGTSMNREATVLAHKTFHHYTTRRKQGGSQSANDNSKGNAHSAGSSLRRYNEQALVADVRALLQDWRALLDTSELLFIRATGSTNRRTLFGPYEGQVLRHNDARLRGFPFSTKRATQNELMRAFIELTRLKVRQIDPAREAKEVQQQQAAAPSKAPSSKPVKPKLSEEEETALLHTSQLQAFIRRSKLPALLAYLTNNQVSADFEFQPPDQHHRTPRPLHMAAAQNSAPLVLGLLTRAGADPLPQNVEGRTAFELAGDRATRDAFRVARSELGESKWAWEAAKVPPAMTKAEADAREEREKRDAANKESDRRKAEEERLKTEGPSVAENGDRVKSGLLAPGNALAKTAQQRRAEETRGMTPEMLRRLERERRARAAEERLRRMQGGQ